MSISNQWCWILNRLPPVVRVNDRSAKALFGSDSLTNPPTLEDYESMPSALHRLLHKLIAIGMLRKENFLLTFEPYNNFFSTEVARSRLDEILNQEVIYQNHHGKILWNKSLHTFCEDFAEFFQKRGFSFNPYLGNEAENYVFDHYGFLEKIIHEFIIARGWANLSFQNEINELRNKWKNLSVPKRITLYLLLPAHAPKPQPETLKKIALEYFGKKTAIQFEISGEDTTSLESFVRFSLVASVKSAPIIDCLIGKKRTNDVLSTPLLLQFKTLNLLALDHSESQSIIDHTLQIARICHQNEREQLALKLLEKMMRGHSIVEEQSLSYFFEKINILSIKPSFFENLSEPDALSCIINLFNYSASYLHDRNDLEKIENHLKSLIFSRFASENLVSQLTLSILTALKEKNLSLQQISQQLCYIATSFFLFNIKLNSTEITTLAFESLSYIVLMLDQFSFVFPKRFPFEPLPFHDLIKSQIEHISSQKNSYFPFHLFTINHFLHFVKPDRKFEFFIKLCLQNVHTPLDCDLLALLPKRVMECTDSERTLLCKMLEPWIHPFPCPTSDLTMTFSLLRSNYSATGLSLYRKFDFLNSLPLKELIEYLVTLKDHLSEPLIKEVLIKALDQDDSIIIPIIDILKSHPSDEELNVKAEAFIKGRIKKAASLEELHKIVSLLNFFTSLSNLYGELFQKISQNSSNYSTLIEQVLGKIFEKKIYINTQYSNILLRFLKNGSKTKILKEAIKKLLIQYQEELTDHYAPNHEQELKNILKSYGISSFFLIQRHILSCLISLQESIKMNDHSQMKKILSLIDTDLKTCTSEQKEPVLAKITVEFLVCSPNLFLTLLNWFLTQTENKRKFLEQILQNYSEKFSTWAEDEFFTLLYIYRSHKSFSDLVKLLSILSHHISLTRIEDFIELAIESKFFDVKYIISLFKLQDLTLNFERLLKSLAFIENAIFELLTEINDQPKKFLLVLSWLCKIPEVSKESLLHYIYKSHQTKMFAWPAEDHYQCIALFNQVSLRPSVHPLISSAIQRFKNVQDQNGILIKVIISSEYAENDRIIQLFTYLELDSAVRFEKELFFLLDHLLSKPCHMAIWKDLLQFCMKKPFLRSYLYNFLDQNLLMEIAGDAWKETSIQIVSRLIGTISKKYISKLIEFLPFLEINEELFTSLINWLCLDYEANLEALEGATFLFCKLKSHIDTKKVFYNLLLAIVKAKRWPLGLNHETLNNWIFNYTSNPLLIIKALVFGKKIELFRLAISQFKILLSLKKYKNETLSDCEDEIHSFLELHDAMNWDDCTSVLEILRNPLFKTSEHFQKGVINFVTVVMCQTSQPQVSLEIFFEFTHQIYLSSCQIKKILWDRADKLIMQILKDKTLFTELVFYHIFYSYLASRINKYINSNDLDEKIKLLNQFKTDTTLDQRLCEGIQSLLHSSFQDVFITSEAKELISTQIFQHLGCIIETRFSPSYLELIDTYIYYCLGLIIPSDDQTELLFDHAKQIFSLLKKYNWIKSTDLLCLEYDFIIGKKVGTGSRKTTQNIIKNALQKLLKLNVSIIPIVRMVSIIKCIETATNVDDKFLQECYDFTYKYVETIPYNKYVNGIPEIFKMIFGQFLILEISHPLFLNQTKYFNKFFQLAFHLCNDYPKQKMLTVLSLLELHFSKKAPLIASQVGLENILKLYNSASIEEREHVFEGKFKEINEGSDPQEITFAMKIFQNLTTVKSECNKKIYISSSLYTKLATAVPK